MVILTGAFVLVKYHPNLINSKIQKDPGIFENRSIEIGRTVTASNAVPDQGTALQAVKSLTDLE
jgi:hypothetical protein